MIYSLNFLIIAFYTDSLDNLEAKVNSLFAMLFGVFNGILFILNVMFIKISMD